ncbi:nucleotide-binding protein [Candidatus Woesearchaeota archaeon]|nr:nucleotide-binding protein [Candidatus Woesearchaeota archaeon]
MSLHSKILRKTVLLDTNFLLIPGQFGVDIFAGLYGICSFQYEVCVLDATLAELDGIASDKKASAKNRRAAGLGLQLLKAKAVKVIKVERKVFKSTDKAILDFAAANRDSVVVATQDKELREKLRAKGVSVVVLRQRQYLVLQ